MKFHTKRIFQIFFCNWTITEFMPTCLTGAVFLRHSVEKLYWLLGRRCISMPNFVKIGQAVVKILRFFNFSRWRRPPSWIVQFAKFHWLTVAGWPRRITSPNFVKIGQSVEDIKIVRFFKVAAVRHLGFVWCIFGPPTVSIWGSL